jgi:membrane-associated phospholipid phosphatase
MKNIKRHLSDKNYVISLVFAFLFFLLSIVTTFFAITYATEIASNSVTDIVLSNVRTFDVDGLFLYGPIVFWLVLIPYFIFYETKKIPFILKSIGLFLFVRSFAMSLTHIGPFPTQIQPDISGILGVFTSGGDLFFSSHTGLPFLMALIMWDKKPVRIFCLVSSVFFGIVVLLAHVHYSIDVFAAFFVTYTIYAISKYLFKSDWNLFHKGIESSSNA